MKKIMKACGLTFLIVVVFLAITAIFVSPRVNPGLSFGYYGQYNIAKNAIKRSQCVDSVGDYVVQTDIFSVERFIFKIHTKSGRNLRLSFAEEMDIRQVCEHPKGIIYYGPSRERQIYNNEFLSKILREKNIRIENVNDLLCHIDDLEMILEANHENEAIPPISQNSSELRGYLAVDLRP
jgi:hypothetical protein